MGRMTAGPYYDMSEAVCSYDALRLGLYEFGILIRGTAAPCLSCKQAAAVFASPGLSGCPPSGWAARGAL